MLLSQFHAHVLSYEKYKNHNSWDRYTLRNKVPDFNQTYMNVNLIHAYKHLQPAVACQTCFSIRLVGIYYAINYKDKSHAETEMSCHQGFAY